MYLPYTVSVPSETSVDVTVEFETPLFDDIVMEPRGSRRAAPETGPSGD